MSAHLRIVTCLLAEGLPLTSVASDLALDATLTTEYIYRGIAMSGGNPALQGGLDFAMDNGLFVGVWATTVDLASSAGRRDAELDYYAGWRWRNDTHFSTALTVLRYTYPGSSGEHRYDYTEYLASLSFDDRWSLEYGYTADLLGFGADGHHWQLDIDWPLTGGIMLGTRVGRGDIRGDLAADYLHWDVGASVRLDRITLDLRWYGNERVSNGLLRTLVAGDRLVFSVSASLL